MASTGPGCDVVDVAFTEYAPGSFVTAGRPPDWLEEHREELGELLATE